MTNEIDRHFGDHLMMLAIVVGVGFLIVILAKKYMRFRKSLVEQESLLEEVTNLNKKVLLIDMDPQGNA